MLKAVIKTISYAKTPDSKHKNMVLNCISNLSVISKKYVNTLHKSELVRAPKFNEVFSGGYSRLSEVKVQRFKHFDAHSC